MKLVKEDRRTVPKHFATIFENAKNKILRLIHHIFINKHRGKKQLSIDGYAFFKKLLIKKAEMSVFTFTLDT